MKSRDLFAQKPFDLLGLVCVCASLPVEGRAQEAPLVGVLGRAVEDKAAEALALFGMIAVPNDAASTISLDGGSAATDFFSFQTGGGFHLTEGSPLYLEGFLGYQRYNPTFVLSNGTDTSETRARWNAVALTGGVGWDFPLSERFTLRPMVHVTLGTVVSDLELGAKFLGNQTGADLDFLIDGTLVAAGYGASLNAKYEIIEEAFEFEITARLSHLELQTVGGSSDLDATSDASVASFWTRYRRPIPGWMAFRQPVRWVVDGSIGFYDGGPTEFPGIDWLAGVGAGLELDVSETPLIFTQRARLMGRVYFGENYRGYGLSVAISF